MNTEWTTSKLLHSASMTIRTWVHRGPYVLVATFHFLSLSSSKLQAQKVFQVTMPNMETTSISKLKLGDSYQVKVSGVNLNLYRVEIDAEEVFALEPIPFPNFAGVDLEGLDKVISGIKGGENTAASGAPTAGGIQDVAAAQKAKAQKEARAALNAAGDGIEKLLVEIKTLSTKIEAWYFEAQLARIGYLRVPRTTCEKKSANDLATIMNKGEVLRTEAGGISERLQALVKEYAAKNNGTSLAGLSENDPAVKDHEKMKVSLDKVGVAVSDLLSATAGEKASQMLLGLLDLDNASSTEFASIPRRYDGGDVFMELKITPIEKASHLPSYTTGQFKWPTACQPYMAVGPSFYVSDLYDQDVSVGQRAVGDSTVHFLRNEPRSDREIGAALKFVAGVPVGKELGVHVSIGPGLSISNPVKPRLLYGLGLSYGREHKVVLDFGGIYGAVTRRRATFSNDDGYPAEPENVTTQRVMGGGYVSLGYLYVIRPKAPKKTADTSQKKEENDKNPAPPKEAK